METNGIVRCANCVYKISGNGVQSCMLLHKFTKREDGCSRGYQPKDWINKK